MKILSAILLISTFSFSQENRSFDYGESQCSCSSNCWWIKFSLHMLLKWPKLGEQIDFEGKIYILAFLDSFGNLDSTSVIKGFGFGFNDEAYLLLV